MHWIQLHLSICINFLHHVTTNNGPPLIMLHYNSVRHLESKTFKLLWFHLQITNLHAKSLHWFIDSMLTYNSFMNLNIWLAFSIYDNILTKCFQSKLSFPAFLSKSKIPGWLTIHSWHIVVLRILQRERPRAFLTSPS